MCRHHPRKKFTFSGDDSRLVFERIISALANQFRNIRLFQKVFVEPTNLGQHLQVGKVLGLKNLLRTLWRIPSAAEPLPQLPVTWITANYVRGMGLKQILQSETSLIEGKIIRGLSSHLKERIVGFTRNVVLDLGNERWHQIESLMNVGKLIQQFDHPVVVLQRVQARPG